ncbi:MAG: hypothetical protein KDI92_14385, partial [Xanthomonadales bacterium]|nr:hypothetical protein [Xanthomonadales bacterium]
MSEIERPEWLNPENYHIAEKFTFQDWHGQILARHILSDEIENKESKLDLPEIYGNGIYLDFGKNLNAKSMFKDIG